MKSIFTILSLLVSFVGFIFSQNLVKNPSFEDGIGNQVALLVQSTNSRVEELDFGDNGQIFAGLQIDVSDCTGLGTNDIAWIYLK